MVVDSNVLNDPILEQFLLKSKNNKAVLIDFAQIEAVKAVNLNMLRERIEPLSKYASQVIILKSTKLVSGMSGRTKGLKRRLVDPKQTKDFLAFCKQLNGNATIDITQQNLIMRGAGETKTYLDKMNANLCDFIQHYEEFEKKFTSNEILEIRKTGYPSTSAIKKLFTLISGVSGEVFRKHPNAHKWPKNHEWPNHFIYRRTVFNFIHFLEWIKKGSPKNMKIDRIQNDMIDITFCSYATYFDGLLTKDKKCHKTFIAGNDMLKNILIPALEARK